MADARRPDSSTARPAPEGSCDCQRALVILGEALYLIAFELGERGLVGFGEAGEPIAELLRELRARRAAA